MGAQHSELAQIQSGEFQKDKISFFVNGKEVTVNINGCDPEIGPQYLLVDYLRDKLGLTGTKYMCREGGCGSCMVTIRSTQSTAGQDNVISANSCLLPLFACDGLDITTIENLGNRKAGYSQIQQRLVQFGGTQCGFCTPGFVMNMHSLVESNPRFTTGDVEYSFDGNICRCTGLRPIIEAFKSLSSNPSEELRAKCGDIEDVPKCPMKLIEEKLEFLQLPRNIHLQGVAGEQWFKVTSIGMLFDVLEKFVDARKTYRLVAGNTGTGVFKNDGPYDGFIEINDVPELHFTSLDSSGIVIGGGVTITQTIAILDKASGMEGFVYAKEVHDHLRRVAALPVRNRGTISGNLMLKHLHREFPSDVFVLLESIGASLRIGSSPSYFRQYTLLEFLDLDMIGKVILSIHLPTYRPTYFYRSYKIGKRYQNAHAYVNAGILINVDPKTFTVLSRPSICFGGISPNFVHALATEEYLEGKVINATTLQGAMMGLEHEVVPDVRAASASPRFRLGLAQSYLYRTLMAIRGNTVTPILRSGAYEIERGNNKATQSFGTDRTKWPLGQPVPKLESFPQVSGEAEYINDMRPEYGELFGVFVLSTVAKATIRSVDASQALAMPGVVAFITAKDIPGPNNHNVFLTQPEEIFADGTIKYCGQPIGLLVAQDKYAAFGARPRVVVTYDNIQPPVLDIKIAVENQKELQAKKRELEETEEQPYLAFPCRGINAQVSKQLMMNISKPLEHPPEEKDKFTGNVHSLKGVFTTHHQYHFHMETQNCICIPNEDGMVVYSGTQHMDHVQAAVARTLNMTNNSIVMQVRRLGGAFGSKISKANHVATACAVAAHVTNKPVRVQMDLETNMEMIGKRLPYLCDYQVQVDDNGKIIKLEADIYCDGGAVANEPTSLYGMICMQSCYRGYGWNCTPRVALTDLPPNTYCRSPGSAQGAAIIEHIMEHIAYTVKKDPLDVRVVNFMKKGDPFIGVPGAKLPLENLLPGMIAELKVSGDYDARKKYVASFNQSNRWRKRGMGIVTQRYPNYYPDLRFPTFISVVLDGTVNVVHAGIEIGQGINTKVAQVVAYTLQIALDRVRVKPASNVVNPNTGITGASVASELVCSSARLACQQLLERLEPLRRQLGTPTWEQLIAAANGQELLLTSQAQQQQGDLTSYDIWGTTLIEVEVDVLTGDYKIVRCDSLNDAGQSVSPLVDIGQLEGALIMGLGWWLTEELIYDRNTGELLTNNTWEYKPMLPADIPEDLRTTMLQNAPNPFGVLSSKATGECPLNMSCCVLMALRNAIDSARRDVGNYSWYPMNGPVTREVIRDLCLTSPEHFSF